jgi:RHS repeat-associated protein
MNYLFGDHSLGPRDRLGSQTAQKQCRRITRQVARQAITANNDGTKTGEKRYYAWGTERYTYGATPTTFHYTGQRLESYINLYWYGSRWYDAQLGRWIQPDQIVPDSQGVQAYDRYAYVNNSPVNYTDPSGHMMTQCGADNEECGASLAQINYETQRYYYENCSSGYGGGCPDYTEDIIFTGLGLVTAGAGEPVVDAVGGFLYTSTSSTLLTIGAWCTASPTCGRLLGINPGTEITYPTINTPYGPAYQEMTESALTARNLIENGAPLYKYGTLGISNGTESQFWSLENPLTNPNYINNLGIPAGNIAANNTFILTGQALPNANFITRSAPGIGSNAGGAIEAVFESFWVKLTSFFMP